MRTRFLTKLTNGEVEQYLNRNDIIYVPVGVVEAHGGFPLESETVLAEAFALKMAEATDGLVLPNLPYFFAGATPSGRGTIQMSIADGMSYLNKIAKSLLNQGFRRQVYITFHGPGYLTVSPMIRDFFEQTKVPILYIDMITALSNLKNIELDAMEQFNTITIGGYSVLGRLEEIPLNVPESDSLTYSMEKFGSSIAVNPSSPLSKLAYQSGAVGYYFHKPLDHMPTPLLKTAEERAIEAEAGVKLIDDIVAAMDMNAIVQTLQEVDDYTKNIVMPKYGAHLPGGQI